VSEAATVAEAVAALAAGPDWVLLDLMLPDGCGLEVFRKAPAASPASRFCVVTGCGPALVESAQGMGIEHVMTKPVDVRRLVALLETTAAAGKAAERE
jgi:DNA-binding NarL/FixJ family response regulator